MFRSFSLRTMSAPTARDTSLQVNRSPVTNGRQRLLNSANHPTLLFANAGMNHAPDNTRADAHRCVPSKESLAQLTVSTVVSADRPHANTVSLENMVRLEGSFRMGSESPEAFPTDGKGPVQLVALSAYYLSGFAATNAQFAEFVRRTGVSHGSGTFRLVVCFPHSRAAAAAGYGNARHALVGARGWRGLGAPGRA